MGGALCSRVAPTETKLLVNGNPPQDSPKAERCTEAKENSSPKCTDDTMLKDESVSDSKAWDVASNYYLKNSK
jgi:hypothetical protein